MEYELAARWYAREYGVSLEQARVDINNPENLDWLISALGMARAGELNYLLGQPAPAPAPAPVQAPSGQLNLLPVAPGQQRTTPVTPTVTQVTPVTYPATPGVTTPSTTVNTPAPATPPPEVAQPVTTTPIRSSPEDLMALFISRVQGIPFEQAVTLLATPAYASMRASLMAAAQAGQLDYLQPGGSAGGGAAGGGDAAQQWQDYLKSVLAGNEKDRYSELARALITASAGLRGPRDYQAFVQSTSAGRSLIDQLYGSQPRPTFSAPTAAMEPLTIQDLISRLGLGAGGAGTTPATGDQASARGLPLPHQINPGVWDALGSVGQQLTLGMAEGQGWDADEFTRQLNAARPMGTAGRSTRYQYQSPQSFF